MVRRKSSTKIRLANVHLGKRLPCKIANASFISRPEPGTVRSPAMTSFLQDDLLTDLPVSRLRRQALSPCTDCPASFMNRQFSIHRLFVSQLRLDVRNTATSHPQPWRPKARRLSSHHRKCSAFSPLSSCILAFISSTLYTSVSVALSYVFCVVASFGRCQTKYRVILLRPETFLVSFARP